jgi:hypothetical protein
VQATFIDTKRPDGHQPATSPASPARRDRREREGDVALVAERKKIAKQFPNLVDYESKRAFRTSTTRAHARR